MAEWECWTPDEAKAVMIELRETLRAANITLPSLGVESAAYSSTLVALGCVRPDVAEDLIAVIRDGLDARTMASP